MSSIFNKCNKIITKTTNSYKINNKSLLSLHNNKLCDVSLPSDKQIDNMYLFSKQISQHSKISYQKATGRCWLFAALNMIRSQFILSRNLPKDFEFSQSYLFFWDKYERINYFFESCQNTKNKELDSQLVQNILQSPVCDGGQWQMFVNLVTKYGLVPKSVYPETLHSSNSAELNMVLKKMLREYCMQIRNNKHGRKRGRVNPYPNNSHLSSRLFEEPLEEGEVRKVRKVREGGTKQKKNKIKLNTIKKQDLIKICKKNKLKGYSKLNKEQLIKFVKTLALN